MKQILEYLHLEKLGTPVLPPFKKFEGLMAAKVSRRNSESFVVAKWNEDFLTPDVAFDPNANFGMIDEFLKLYENEDEENSEVNLSQNSIDTAFDEFRSLEDGNTELSEDNLTDSELDDLLRQSNDNEEVDEELGREGLEASKNINGHIDNPLLSAECLNLHSGSGIILDSNDISGKWVEEDVSEEQLEPKETFPIFETLKGDELSKWLLSRGILHKLTLSKPEKVKLCEKYVLDLAKPE